MDLLNEYGNAQYALFAYNTPADYFDDLSAYNIFDVVHIQAA